MQITVLSRLQAMMFKCNEPWAAISIADANQECADLSSEYRVGLLQLRFDDIIDQGPTSFRPEQAVEIFRFVNDVRTKINLLLVHCAARISRSPAVAAVLHRFMIDNDDSFYFRTYAPNALVYRTMMEVGKL